VWLPVLPPPFVSTGARDGAMASVEVLVGPERRRRWSVEQKQAIVAAAFRPGVVVRDVARQADVTPSLIYRWRRDLRAAANGFAQVLVAPAGDGVAAPAVPAIDIELPGNARVRIPSSVPPALAAAVVEALARR
jgi:transposase